MEDFINNIIPTTPHVLRSIKSSWQVALKYAEKKKKTAKKYSSEYYLAEGEINAINGCISTIDITLALFK